jgi:hypothetical protein
MTANEKVARRKLSLLELAKELSNVSCVWQRHDLLSKHDRLLRLEKTHREPAIELNDEQIRLLERFSPEFRERQIEVHYTGELVAVDTLCGQTQCDWMVKQERLRIIPPLQNKTSF